MLGACSLGGLGHLRPLGSVLDMLRDRGDTVAVVAPPAMADQVASIGHAFLPGGGPPESDLAPLREQLSVLDADDASIVGNRDLFGRLATAAMLEPVREVVETWTPDLIVRDPCEYASAVVALGASMPVVQVAISLAEVEWGSISAASPALEEWCAGLTEAVRSTGYLTRLPESLDPSPFPSTVRFRERSEAAAPLPDWWPGDHRPLVYATFGTVLGHMSTAVESMKVLLDAVGRLDARVLLTTGRAVEPAVLGSVPEHVHVEQWVEQASVLDEASVVVCHGGSGTTFGALAEGLPVVVVPMFADQAVNAGVVARAGAGIVVRPTDRRQLLASGADAIESAVRVLIDDVSRVGAGRRGSGFAGEATRIATEMAAMPVLLQVVTDRGVPIARVVGIDASTKLVRLTDEGVIGRPRSGKRPVARDRTRPRPRRSVTEHVTEQRR